ncbi:hypothetical protein ACIG47_02930 [Promicromonospora sp. NPDC052451]|uniref:hypothetical protein n=1 Tax=Promicromonospora sp. NPDC052451 TaxID=3364407 RepID=UPI0037C59847
MTQFPGGVPLMGWLLVASGVLGAIRLWREAKKYRTKAVPRPGGRMARISEGLALALAWLMGGALVLFPVAPAASVVMAVVAVLCLPVVVVCTGLVALFRVDELAEWMGWPRSEGRWRRGVLQGVGLAHTVGGVGISVIIVRAALALLDG